MKFRLTTMLWAFALLASALATFGGAGILVATFVIAIWSFIINRARGKLSEWLMAVAIVVGLVGLLLPAIQSAQEAARRSSCIGRIYQLKTALLLHENLNGSFPIAAQSDPNSNHLHSWRVWMVPHIGPPRFFSRYRKDEPWNSRNNKQAVIKSRMNFQYQCPSHATNQQITHFYAIIGKQTMWPLDRGRKISEITDGTSNTIMLIEASHKAVPWAKPEDLSLEDAVELLTNPPATVGFGHVIDEGFFYKPSRVTNVAFANGDVRLLGLPISRKHAVALLTVDGGEELSPDDVRRLTSPELDYGRIYALCVFLLLSLAPIVKLGRGSREAVELES